MYERVPESGEGMGMQRLFGGRTATTRPLRYGGRRAKHADSATCFKFFTVQFPEGSIGACIQTERTEQTSRVEMCGCGSMGA